MNGLARSLLRASLATLLIPLALATSQHVAGATPVCPAVGADTTCGTIITVTNSGATVTSTGQGPYDGFDDTLVGVVNNSRLPVKVLALKSGADIFGFDGDGIDTYGIAGNGRDGSGYGGPNAYYTKINASQTAGQVNFIVPIPVGGGTSYFSLEDAISSSVACQDLINKAVSSPVPNGNMITSRFTPKMNYTLQTAARFCGFVNFDWQQTITSWPLPSPLLQLNNKTPLHAPPPFLDPPPGGYVYTGPIHDYPFYYDPNNTSAYANGGLNLANNVTPAGANATTLKFFDRPADPCLPGGKGIGCNGKTAPKGSVLAFTTHLAGVNADGTATDLGIGFKWKSTFNGTSGGTSKTLNPGPTDPGSGTGGVTVTSVTDTTYYQYDGVTVTSVNPTEITGNYAGPLIVTGSTIVSDALVGGPILVQPGASLDLENSTVRGTVDATKSPGAIRLCGTTIEGQLLISNASGGLYFGAVGDPGCGPDTIDGSVVIQ